MSGRPLLLDTGALTHAGREPRGQVVADCAAALALDLCPLLPSVVYARVWRGDTSQQGVTVVRRFCRLLAFTAETADAVDRLLRASGTSDVVGAAVVVAAIQHGAVVLTDEPDYVGWLAAAAGYRVPVLAV